MAYTYKLEALLTFRTNLEELAQQGLTREKKLLENHRKRLEELKISRYLTIEEFERKKKSVLPAYMLLFYMESIYNMDREIQGQQTMVESQEKVVEQARQNLLDKVKDRKVIERAREKDYENYLQRLRHEEQKEADEMAVLRYDKERVHL